MLTWWCPVYRWRELVAGTGMEQENLSPQYRWPVEMGLAPWLREGGPQAPPTDEAAEYRCGAQGRTGPY